MITDDTSTRSTFMSHTAPRNDTTQHAHENCGRCCLACGSCCMPLSIPKRVANDAGSYTFATPSCMCPKTRWSSCKAPELTWNPATSIHPRGKHVSTRSVKPYFLLLYPYVFTHLLLASLSGINVPLDTLSTKHMSLLRKLQKGFQSTEGIRGLDEPCHPCD